MEDTPALNPNCRSDVHRASCSLSKMIKSNSLPSTLLKVMARKLSDVHMRFLTLGIGIIVPATIKPRLVPCTSMALNNIQIKHVGYEEHI